jgi:hypothetical protein
MENKPKLIPKHTLNQIRVFFYILLKNSLTHRMKNVFYKTKIYLKSNLLIVLPLIIIITFSGYITFIHWSSSNIGFSGDQVRDVILAEELNKNRVWSSYGVPTSRGFFILPFYYNYLQITNLLHINLDFLSLLNAIQNYVAIFVLLITIFFCVKSTTKSKTLFLPAFGLIYFLNFYFIRQANTLWNPNLSNLYLILLIVTLLKTESSKNLIWFILISALANILMGLHGSFLILIPIFVMSLAIIWKWHWKNILVTIFCSLLFSSNYWFSEITSNLSNTRKVVYYILSNSDNLVGFSIWDKFTFYIHNFVFNWFVVVSEIYLPNLYQGWVIVFGVLSVYGFVIAQKTNSLAKLSLCLIVIYLLTSVSQTGIYHAHFMTPVALLPPIGLLFGLIYIKNRIVKVLILFLLVLTIIQNYQPTQRYFQEKFGNGRNLNTNDYKIITELAKEKNIFTICFDAFEIKNNSPAIKYFSNNEITITDKCNSGNWYIIPRKFGLAKLPSDLAKPEKMIFNNSSFEIYEF